MFDWKIGRLGDLAKGIRGVSYTPDQLREFKSKNTVTLLRSNNIQDGNLTFDDVQIVPRYVVSEEQLLRQNDIAVCMSNGSKALVGKSAQLRDVTSDSLTVGAFCALFRPVEDSDKRFISYVFQSKSYRKQLDLALAGTAINNLRSSELEAFPVSIPPTLEQQKIGAILYTLDTTIRKTEAIIEKLKQIKQGLLHDLLTRGIAANGELRPPYEQAPHLYKASPLGWIPKEWNMGILSDVAAVSRGKFTHRPRNDPAYYGGIYPFIQTGDVAAALGGIVTIYSQTLSELGVKVSQEFPVGTIAITIAANIADTAILGIPMYFPDSVVGAVVETNANRRFIELCIRAAKPRLESRAPQSAQKNINLQDLRPLPIPLPIIAEQDCIAERYETIRARIEKEEMSLAKYKNQKSALMDDLLTGRVRVTPLLQGHDAPQNSAFPSEDSA